jgi:2-polyprenyl-6-methoxyphenol hydroxylase-like FAD-dependent oxidoreductase
MPQSDPDVIAHETLRLIGPDPQNWVPDREGIDHNVLVIGGGQSGSTFAFALRRAGIGKVSLIDAAKDHAGSGVWLTSARMQKLRTLKTCDIPSVVARISRDLLLADLARHEERINGLVAEDFDASLYASAVWRSPQDAAAE